MSSSGLTVTVVGWAATTPREISGDGVPYTSFRVATTPRRYDSRVGAWTDGHTEWITVKAFRDVALNVGSSIRKGDPVLATGRLRTEEWQGESGPRTSLVLDVTALGHDLTRGRAAFTRTMNVAGDATRSSEVVGRSGAAGHDGAPADDPWSTAAGTGLVDEDEIAEEGEPDSDAAAASAAGPGGAALQAAGSGRAAGTP